MATAMTTHRIYFFIQKCSLVYLFCLKAPNFNLQSKHFFLKISHLSAKEMVTNNNLFKVKTQRLQM